MGRSVEKIWVEPRLRGFVVLADRRNPPSSVRRCISYEAGAAAYGGGGGALPAGPGIEPPTGVMLDVVSISAHHAARRAIERDFRRRVFEGRVHHEFERPWRGLRWMTLVLAGVVVGLIGLDVVLRGSGSSAAGVPLAGALLALTWAAMLFAASRANTRSARIEGGFIAAELRTGESIRRPLADIERVRIFPMAASIQLRGGPRLRVYWNMPPNRAVLFALRHPHQYARAKQEKREMRSMARRCVLVYFPLAAAPLGVVYGLTQTPAFGLPGSSPLVGPAVAAAIYGVFLLQFGVCWLMCRIDKAFKRHLAQRDRRRRRSVRPRPPSSPHAPFQGRLAHR